MDEILKILISRNHKFFKITKLKKVASLDWAWCWFSPKPKVQKVKIKTQNKKEVLIGPLTSLLKSYPKPHKPNSHVELCRFDLNSNELKKNQQ
jgi:hypothetical protein